MKAVIKYNVGTERQTKRGKYVRQVVADYKKNDIVKTVVATLWSVESMEGVEYCEIWFSSKTKTWYGRPDKYGGTISV